MKIKTIKGRTHVPAIIKKQKFDPDQEFIDEEINKFLVDGGKIKKLGTEDLSNEAIKFSGGFPQGHGDNPRNWRGPSKNPKENIK